MQFGILYCIGKYFFGVRNYVVVCSHLLLCNIFYLFINSRNRQVSLPSRLKSIWVFLTDYERWFQQTGLPSDAAVLLAV